MTPRTQAIVKRPSHKSWPPCIYITAQKAYNNRYSVSRDVELTEKELQLMRIEYRIFFSCLSQKLCLELEQKQLVNRVC